MNAPTYRKSGGGRVTQPLAETVVTVDGARTPVVRDCFLAAGHWYCVTHQQHFPNNLQASAHEDTGRHLSVWLCDEHGPEGGQA